MVSVTLSFVVVLASTHLCSYYCISIEVILLQILSQIAQIWTHQHSTTPTGGLLPRPSTRERDPVQTHTRTTKFHLRLSHKSRLSMARASDQSRNGNRKGVSRAKHKTVAGNRGKVRFPWKLHAYVVQYRLTHYPAHNLMVCFLNLRKNERS